MNRSSASPERAGRSSADMLSHIPGLTSNLQRIAVQWRQSQARTFLMWWRAGLVDCLPKRMRALLDRRDADILLRLDACNEDDDGNDDGNDHGNVDSDHANAEINIDTLFTRPYNASPGTRVILVLPQRAVLIKPMRFPLAARDNLRAIAAFELDRQTPFTLDQAAFDVHLPHIASHRGKHPSSLSVEVAVMPKTSLDVLTEKIASANWPLHGVDVMTSNGHRLGINLLDPALRAPQRTPERRMTVWLTSVFLVLTAVACYQWQSARETALNDMQTRVSAMRVAAHSVMRLREQVRDQASMASYLTRLKTSRPGMDEVLLQLTTALPDDSWLQQIEVDATGQVRLAGLSAHATALLGRLQQATSLHDVSFQGAIEPDQQTHLDHFYLAGHLTNDAAHRDRQP